MKITLIPIVVDAIGIVTKCLVKGLRNKRTSGANPNSSITEIDKNTEEQMEEKKT